VFIDSKHRPYLAGTAVGGELQAGRCELPDDASRRMDAVTCQVPAASQWPLRPCRNISLDEDEDDEDDDDAASAAASSVLSAHSM